jgi:hypothetical protein
MKIQKVGGLEGGSVLAEVRFVLEVRQTYVKLMNLVAAEIISSINERYEFKIKIYRSFDSRFMMKQT